MLVLSRKIGDQIIIDHDIVVTVLRIDSTTVRLGISAPQDRKILRSELVLPHARRDAGEQQDLVG